jgi:hypothetical protein
VKTAEIQQFLATDPRIQRIVRGRVGQNDDGSWDEDSPPDCDTAKWPDRAKNPKKWVREWKLTYGSKAWIEKKDHVYGTFTKTQLGFDPVGAVVRRFWLRDTDHISIEVWERDGKIVFIDDVSD